MTFDDLTARRALVTGAASGIGLATARALTGLGCDVVLADVADQAGSAAAAEIGATFVHLDVSKPSDWAAVVEGDTPSFDIVHLNAGVSTLWPSGDRPDPMAVRLLKLSDDSIRTAIGVNIEGVVFGLRTMLPGLIARGGGAIVATSSLAGVSGLASDPLYAAAKHAIIGLVRSLEPTLTPLGISIHAVCPGVTETGMLDRGTRLELLESGFPIMAPERVAETVILALRSGTSGQAWVCQPGREALQFQFHRVPAARNDDGSPVLPRGVLAAQGEPESP